MKKQDTPPVKISAIPQLHQLLGMPGPRHPLVSLVDNAEMNIARNNLVGHYIFDFYKISYKKSVSGRMGYGQGFYDFNEGGLVFTAPGQIIYVADDAEYDGASLLFHADFIRNSPLGQQIKKYGFFSYETHESLFLSESEKTIMLGVMENIKHELAANIDDFSQDVLLSYIELLLNYSNRFYRRQFITHKTVSHDLLTRMDQLLESYFGNEDTLNHGLPTVEYLAGQLSLSPRYLSDMLRSLTGLSAQQHIHEKLMEKAKQYLAATTLSVAQIAYQLGFERPQSFNKLFKKKARVSPLEYRQTFN
ncbi:AraC family transcriptional regulator [Flavobacterium akiainvivens]|uniref:AraC family transcriptional regulator n=1 Tax=Flavobacterium akiainvivens TaxID=1202724 RepID=A0A0N0RQX8_9FLAO|nr:helix-turn-helix domain-containing protein [Flavobacterium akiainvivens]KOS07306.1 AraC family transcriptional regulator [Flavobacterium akiainvivens]